MKRINSGKLRAIGYDAKARTLQVRLDNGDMPRLTDYNQADTMLGTGLSMPFEDAYRSST